MPTPQLTPKNKEITPPTDICLFGQTDYRNQMRRFGIKTDDRRRHMYIIGKTGMGKTTIMENMVLHDIYSGHGVGVVDPHGDFAEKIIDYIPSRRLNDIVYFNPADIDFPIGFNILEVKTEEQKHLVAAGLMGIFKKIWPDVWSSRMEYILNNTILALLDYAGSTLLGINRLLEDKKYRLKVVSKLTDPVVKAFWQTEFAAYNDRYAQEAVAPIQNKIGQFLSASVIRNMVAQVKSTINVREMMDSEKILIMNLAKGRIGEDNSRLLGGMLITQLQLAAMERVDTPEKDRKDLSQIGELLVYSKTLETPVSVKDVALIKQGYGPSEIRRKDQIRTITITAAIMKGYKEKKVLERLSRQLGKIDVPKDYTIDLTGKAREVGESFRRIAFATALALILNYMIMAAQFESFLHPFIIMFTVPLALIGVAVALLVTGTALSVISLLGILILGGNVVNNAIVLIDFINQSRREGMELVEACIESVFVRYRPIIMSTVTTVVGLIPLALGIGDGAELQAPLAIGMIGGLTSATFFTLCVIPSVYVLVTRYIDRLFGETYVEEAV